LVDDTPPESGPAFGCPVDLDTCSADGLDPISKSHVFSSDFQLTSNSGNFMDYTDDDCMNEFTPGQTDRLKQQIATFRDFTESGTK